VFFLELAQRANLNEEADGAMLHSLVIPEHNNIRAALEWTTATKRGELGLRLATNPENQDPLWSRTIDPAGPTLSLYHPFDPSTKWLRQGTLRIWLIIRAL